MRIARVQAQAKVNLFLRVGPPRRDGGGYHDIATLFQRIDLADDLIVRAGGSSRSIDCAGPQLPPEGLGDAQKNLAFRAAEAYAEQVGRPHGFSIELTKRIPVGGGLGGGSADAGAVLRALDAIADRPMGAAALQALGASLGADVPFMASEHVRARGSGRGEILSPRPNEPPQHVVLIVPRFGISTADAYRWLDESRPESAALSAEESGNDFESVVEARHPELRRYRERLGALGARIARLSGSGSTVFGVFRDQPPAVEQIANDAQVIVTRTSTRVVQVEAGE